MKKVTIIISFSIFALLSIISLSYLVFSQIPGQFVVGNADPTVSNFEVQEAGGGWDSTIPLQTHINLTALRWDIGDINDDPLTTTLCIGTAPNPYASVACNVVKYTLAVGGDGDTQLYTYGTDPIGTPDGPIESIDFAGSDCSGSPCIKTYYVDIFVDDGQGGTVTSINSYELTDYLPSFNNIYISNAELGSDDSCEDFLPAQNCTIQPREGDYTSVNINLTITDLDADCSDSNHYANVILCRVDIAAPELCDPSNNAHYDYDLSYASIDGSNCNFTIAIPVSDPAGIEFFREPGTYKMYIEARSQAGTGTSGFPAAPRWQYLSLIGPTFPSQVYLGDRAIDGGDDIQLDAWNPGLDVNSVVNGGNLILTLDWEATDPRETAHVCTEIAPDCCSASDTTCWNLGDDPDLQLDDDSDQVDDTGNLAVVNVPEEGVSTVEFNPVGGLQLCDVFTCDTGIDETLDIAFHIHPPLGLQAGTYNTDFGVTATEVP
jgi:hypothetical protein